MGLLRLILALSVVAAHAGPPMGVKFFGNGVMSVESFYMLSGFYMALILETKYRERAGVFYFNRFIRLFPLYWLLLAVAVLGGFAYWAVAGHPLGPLAAWIKSENKLHLAWAGFSNLMMVGSDWAELISNLQQTGKSGVDRLLFIPPVWSLAIEITFYLGAPLVLRASRLIQLSLFGAALLLRMLIWHLHAGQWSDWLYYFAPATWVFFMGGVMAWHAYTWLQTCSWFGSFGKRLGWVLTATLCALILFYTQLGWLHFDDPVYFILLGAALPFIFAATRESPVDASLAAWSYPIYLAHWVVISFSTPLRHFIAKPHQIYVVLAGTLVLSYVAIRADRLVQRRFKRAI